MHELPHGEGERPLPALLIVPANTVDDDAGERVAADDGSNDNTGPRIVDDGPAVLGGGGTVFDPDGDHADPPPPVDPPPPERRSAVRWYCSRQRVVLGVAGGLADSLALDPVVVRLVFVGMTVLSPFGILIYLAARLAVAAGRGAPEPGRVRRVVAAGIAGAGLVGLANTADAHLGTWKFIALLVGLSAALWYTPRIAEPGEWRPPILGGASSPGASTRGSATTPASSAGSAVAPTGEAGSSDAAALASIDRSDRAWPARSQRPRVESLHESPEASAFPTARPTRQRRKRSPFGRIVATIAIATVVIAALAGGSPQQMQVACIVAAVLCVAGVIAGRKFGRARWLLIPGLFAVGGAVVAGAVAGLGVRMGAPWNGDSRFATITTQADVPTVDLRSGVWDLDLRSATEDITLTGRVGLGSIVVRVPFDADVTVRSRVGLGVINVDDGTTTGYRRSRDDTLAGRDDGPKIILDLAVGVGGIDIDRWPADAAFPITPGSLPGLIGTTPNGGLIYAGATAFADSIALDDGSESTPAGHRPSATAIITSDGWMIAGATQVAPNGTVYLPDGTVIPPPWLIREITAQSGSAPAPIVPMPGAPDDGQVFATVPPASQPPLAGQPVETILPGPVDDTRPVGQVVTVPAPSRSQRTASPTTSTVPG